jgi:deazaflavin-dependent oxidoreductase (nitroreductase family)
MVRLNTALLRRGLTIGSQHLLTVPGRRTGAPRSTPVSIAEVGGTRYIVAAFPDAAWVKNVRAARSATLSRGGRIETVLLEELPADARAPILRAFFQQVRGGIRYFGARTPDQIAADGARYPVFRVSDGRSDSAAG